jgi:hypothetical protein
VFTPAWARAALTHGVFTGLSRQHLADLTMELADRWTAAHQSALQQRRGHPRGRRGPVAAGRARLRVDTGYGGLAKAFPDRVCAPPPKPATDAPAEQIAAYKQARTPQSSRRICVEHAIAEHKQWRPLQRYIRRREAYAQTHLAIAGLVSDRAARR